jgi:hypothetical protein
MRGLLILSIIIAIVIFLMPFILGAVIFFITVIALLMLLANFWPLSGVMPRRRRWVKWAESDAPRAGRQTQKTHSNKKNEEHARGKNEEWHGFHDDSEVINLPETALRKDEQE